MKKSTLAALLTLATGTGLVSAQTTGTFSSVQSSARPYGLEIIDQVKLAGSDAAAADFQNNTLPSLQSYANSTLTEGVAITDTSAMRLDPEQLYLATASDVRVYFVGEGAGYHNTLGFNTDGGGINSGDPNLIFPDASSNGSVRTASEPLLAGDFVDLGSFAANTQLDFFLLANAVNGGSNIYSTDISINPDGINHVVAYAVPNSPYIFIGFEDLLNGGDFDFNDVMFVADIGTANVNVLTSAPEPSTWFAMGSFVLIALYWKRRQEEAAQH